MFGMAALAATHAVVAAARQLGGCVSNNAKRGARDNLAKSAANPYSQGAIKQEVYNQTNAIYTFNLI